MLGNLFRPKPGLPEEEIRKERQKFLDEMLSKSACLQNLVGNDKSGWKEFIALLDDYINKIEKRKAITALDRASDAVIAELKLLDHENYILRWVKKIPKQFIDTIDQAVKKENEDA